MPHKKIKGGALSGKEVKEMVSSSYDKKGKKQIGDNVLDESLSNRKVKVYHNSKTGKATVVNRGTKSTVADWANNAIYGLLGTSAYKKTDRYKQAKRTQQKAVEKYGKDNITNVGHSQGGLIARELNKDKLTNQVISVNPASKGEKVRKNEVVIKSSGDIVSALVPKGKNVKVIKAKNYNPLAQHSAKIIRKEDEATMYGGCHMCGGCMSCGGSMSEDEATMSGGCMSCGGSCSESPRSLNRSNLVHSDIVTSEGVAIGGYMSGGSLRLTREFFPVPHRYD